MKKTLFIFGVLLGTSIFLSSCDKTVDPPPDDPPPTTTYCNCNSTDEPMTIIVSSAPEMVFIRLDPDAYGANNVYFYELDETENGFVYHGTQTTIETKIPTKNWNVPSGYIWAAGRAGMDGYDPYVPVITDELIYPYLPWTPGFASWESNYGTINDKTTCPDSNHNNYWLPLCGGLDGKHQLDHKAPQLVTGKWYLARMVMGYNINGVYNVTNACYQRVFKFERGTYGE